MGKLGDFLSGTQILEKAESSINGRIIVEKSLAWGTYISASGLTQSGGIINDIWKKPLKRISNFSSRGRSASGGQFPISNVLILGLGGGTVAKLVKRYWPEVKITGVDIDPMMVELGKKYLELDRTGIEIVIEDAFKYVEKQSKFKSKNKFDLVLVDLYIGDNYPVKFESENYIQLVRSVLANGGVTVFNRLYYGEKRPEAMKFCEKLGKVFKKVDIVFPEVNVMFLCSK